jgi:hypothetical protein
MELDMLYQETENGFEEWYGKPIDGIKYPMNIEAVWSAQELIAIGLYLPVVSVIPDGKIVIGESVARVDGVVTYVYTLVDAPPDPTPQEKLDAFLAENPDVAPLVNP